MPGFPLERQKQQSLDVQSAAAAPPSCRRTVQTATAALQLIVVSVCRCQRLHGAELKAHTESPRHVRTLPQNDSDSDVSEILRRDSEVVHHLLLSRRTLLHRASILSKPSRRPGCSILTGFHISCIDVLFYTSRRTNRCTTVCAACTRCARVTSYPDRCTDSIAFRCTRCVGLRRELPFLRQCHACNAAVLLTPEDANYMQ